MNQVAIHIKQESFAAARAELLPLFDLHQTERHVEIGLPRSIDVEAIGRLEAAGVLFLLTARRNDKLIGYIIWVLAPTHIEYSGTPYASQGPWFVHEDWRNTGAGMKLFRESLHQLKQLNCPLADVHHWDEPTLGRMFHRLGARATTTNFLLNLKELP